MKYVCVLARGSLYFFTSFPFLGLLGIGLNMSVCLESVAVRRAKRLQSFVRRRASRWSPNCSSCLVCDGSQCPVIAAIATLCALSSEWDWATMRPECHTVQPYSSITRPSLFQYSTSECCGTPMALILLMAQVVRVALRTISSH